MKTFLNEDFLLRSDSARRLYHDHAKAMPILDYHCHLPPAQIAADHQFSDLAEVWLAGDHYKWRAMRWNGIPEEFCTGGAAPRDKFLAFARTVPRAIRNPLYHWTHLELLRFFGIDDLLDETTAPAIWDRANAMLAEPHFRTRALIERSNVKALCTTDDPCDDLAAHQALRAETTGFRVYPTFRPDKAFRVDQPKAFAAWAASLEEASGMDCSTLAGFLRALDRRHEVFHALGCRLSDHGIERCPGLFASERKARKIFDQALAGEKADAEDAEKFAGFLMVFLGSLDAQRGWTKQLHLGALRNPSGRRWRELGPDTGFDAIGDTPQAASLARLLDALDAGDALPKMVLYNLNPSDNYAFATLAGSFQEGPAAGKIQFGSGWWFLDQREGIEWQMNALSNLGLLSRFVGMLTDSRSLLSYARHEYFRRILCNLLGGDVERGELPPDFDLLGGIVRDICFENARNFLGLEV